MTIDRVRAGRLGGGPLHAAYGSLAEMAFGMIQARRLLRRLAPAAVIGFGGYTSVPTMLAAARLGFLRDPYPRAERRPGSRQPAPRAARPPHRHPGFAAAGGLASWRPSPSGPWPTGNPVRPAIRAVGASAYAAPAPDGPIELLVLGGSQGARVFGEIVPPALAALPAELRARLRVSQQARPEDKDSVAAHYRDVGIDADIESFFQDMPERLRRAHLVICRAGASTASRNWPRRRQASAARALPARDGRSPNRQRRRIRQIRRRLGHPADRVHPGRPRRPPRRSLCRPDEIDRRRDGLARFRARRRGRASRGTGAEPHSWRG